MNSPIDQSAPIRPGEEINVDQLRAYAAEYLPQGDAPLVVEQFPSGYSNLTYLLKQGDQEFVLRRPPVGNVVQSAHDMGREFRVLSKLSAVFSQAPKPLFFCDDESILGAPFYVMERRRGVILRAANTPEALTTDPKRVRELCNAFVDCLVQLHALDYAAAGLADLGRPDGYVERQVTGWAKRYAKSKTDDVAEMERLAVWLCDHMPPDSPPALIHNDFKYDNLVLDPNDLTRIIGVLDWEMATIGDPLMDLGGTLAYWVQADDPPARKAQAFGPTMLPGGMTRSELVARYSSATNTAAPNMVNYYAFGLFKLAVIVQQIYARYVAGKTRDPRFARLNEMVATLGSAGAEVIETGEL